jgi:sugar O-acyltransferase (sialic acid O-acetyltransferase NeuD family)
VSGPLVVFGAGGHGKVVCDILLSAGETVFGFVDEAKVGARVLDLPVIGGASWLVGKDARVALGVGDNAARARIAEECVRAGASLVTAIHPTAVVARSATVEEGAVVMALAVVNAEARIARGAIVNTAAVIEHDCVVGEFAHVSPNATLAGGCIVKTRAHLGIGASMLPGTTVGEDAVVGGGAVVARDVADRVVAIGVPARPRR